MHARDTFIQCLLAAVGDNENSLIGPAESNYTATVDTYWYNLDYQFTPAAIVFPKTANQVADAVKCAVESGVQVQPRSGGHSYGNYGRFS